MNNLLSLEGKKLLITGASSGIGRSIAIECSHLGASVILVGRNKDRLQDTYDQMTPHVEHLIVAADLTAKDDLDKIVSIAQNLDGVALCAGKGLTLPVAFSSRTKMDDLFEINFFSTVELLRLLYKKKCFHPYASVVAISSLGGTKVFRGFNSIYGASKSALSSFMKFCAKEFSSRKIRVNLISPGMVDTPFIHRDTIMDEQLENDAQTYPLGRYGKPTDIAYMAVFLLSDLSSWVTGQDFIVDGGLSIR